MTVRAPLLTAAFWRSRRSAAIAGIIFGVLLLLAMTMLRIALSADSLQSLRTDSERRTLIRLSLHLVPFAGIAFLWFIGVVRDQLGGVEDRLFSTVFLGSGLALRGDAVRGRWHLDQPDGVARRNERQRRGLRVRPQTIRSLFSIYAMRMAAVFTLAVSPVGIRTSAVPRWVRDLGYLVGLTLLVAAGAYQWTPARIPCLG